MTNTLISFVISFLIGLLIGIEREHSHSEGVQPIGVRTFTLFSMLGTLSAVIGQTAMTVSICLFVFSLIMLSYWRSTSKLRQKNIDIGITTELSAGIVFCLGYLVPFFPLISIAVSSVVLLILLERKRLHLLAREKFNPTEAESVIILMVFALGIVPVLPNRVIDPWGIFNPRNFGILISTIAAIQFSGYMSIRFFGQRFGIPLMGFLGGFVSSTAVFANLPHTLRSYPKSQISILISVILATAAMLVEILIILFVASQSLFLLCLKPLAVMLVSCFGISVLLMYFQKEQKTKALPFSKSLNLSSILLTSAFIAVTLVFIAVAKQYVGTSGVWVTSFLVGLFEIHGITLATSLLYMENHLTQNAAFDTLSIAVLATFISKLFLLWSLTPRQFAFKASLFLFLISGCGFLYLLLK